MTWAGQAGGPDVPAAGGDLESGPPPIAARVAAVRARIEAAARRAGRDPGEVTLVAVSKLHPASAAAAARDAGITDLGESYPQELDAKAAAVPGVRWHMVGRLQRNKAGVIAATGALLHSLDSVKLARAVGRRAAEAGTVAEALVQLERDDREAAHGVRPGDLEAFAADCAGIEGLSLRGLMVMPAAEGDPRGVFARARELAGLLSPDMKDLSMGMSNDLEIAVEEGATLVRVGTAIFGPRPKRRTS
jgi:pyridoxal phosphate enzyme (YggS family)